MRSIRCQDGVVPPDETAGRAYGMGLRRHSRLVSKRRSLSTTICWSHLHLFDVASRMLNFVESDGVRRFRLWRSVKVVVGRRNVQDLQRAHALRPSTSSTPIPGV